MTNLVKKAIKTNNAPAALGPYSQAIVVGDLIYVSGQLGINILTNKLFEGDISLQTKQALINIQSILHSAGSDLSQAIKMTVFLKDMKDFQEMNAVYGTFFADLPPARSTVAVASLPKNALCEIDCIALLKND